MNKQLTERQHFVPQTYLKYFSLLKDDNYYINALPKLNRKTESIFHPNIKEICVNKNIYTLAGDTIEEKMLIENFYSNNLERHYDKVYKIIKDESKLELSIEERELIISTVITMYYRTKTWVNRLNESTEHLYSTLFNMCIQTGKHLFIINDKEVSIKGKNLKEFIKEVNAKNKEKIILMQLKVALELIKERLKSNNIYTSTLIEEDSEFITSDNPVIIENIDIDNIVPFDETNIFTLPIDNKTKLFLMPNTDLSLRFKINKNYAVGYYCRMEAFLSNLNQYERADKFLLGKESSIKKFLLTKDVTELKKTKEEENDWQAILKHLGM